MSKKKTILLSLAVAAMLTAGSFVMAASTTDNSNSEPTKKAAFAKGEFGHKGGKGFHRDNKALLDLLKIDEKTLQESLKSGKTLADVAKQQGVSEQKLKEFMVEQMTKRIDDAAKNGKITDDKKAQIRANIEKRVDDIISGKAPMRGHGPRGHAPFASAKVLDLLKMDKESLMTEMKAGKTLAGIAAEHGVTESALKDVISQEMSQRIDEGVSAGRISADKAEKMKANIDKRVSDRINDKFTMHDRGFMGHKAFNNEKLLALLKMDADSLRTEMKAGKSLVVIAKEHGVSEKSLKNLIIQEMSQKIDESVAQGKLSEDKAKEIKAGMDKNVTNMINGNGPMHKGEHKPKK